MDGRGVPLSIIVTGANEHDVSKIGEVLQSIVIKRKLPPKRRNPKKKARRWVVEVCRSWFNRFRKLLVRYEKLQRSFIHGTQPFCRRHHRERVIELLNWCDQAGLSREECLSCFFLACLTRLALLCRAGSA